MLATLEEKVDPRNAALIVVDVQNDFCHSDGSLARNGSDMTAIQAMVPRLEGFLAEARRIGLPIVFIRTERDDATKSDAWREQRQRTGRDPTVCDKGTWGAEFYRVAPEPGEPVIIKHRYSAFIGTNLDTTLRSMGVKSILTCGVATNVCVESTARDGAMLDYYLVFMDDLSATGSQELHEATLTNMRNQFGQVVTADEVVAAWRRLRVAVSSS